MSEWWTYTLSDFLLFSPRVYYRLFELHNRALWPAQLLTMALGLTILLMMLRPVRGSERSIPALLGVLWIWIAWSFFIESYATINWAAIYVAPVFALQGLLLIWVGSRGHLAFASGRANVAGIGLFALALAGYPLIAPAMGRPWIAAEIFGIAPDPTSVATLAVLALVQGRVRWLLMVIPCLWCIVTGATLWTMESAEYFVAPLGALAAVGIALLRRAPERAEQDRDVHG
jgi:uncharacterized protein DUF6064